MRRSSSQQFGPSVYPPQTPGPLSAPLSAPGAFKRPFGISEAPYGAGREIRPKPGPYPTSVASTSSAPEPPPKRKRGRPTKASVQARAAEPGPAPPVAMSPQAIQPATAAPAVQEEPKQTFVPTTRMPISAVLTPTAPKTASSSGSSSGKRMRTRSTRSEPEGYPMEVTAGGEPEYESPYAREPAAIDPSGPSPARAAVMRHQQPHSEPPPQFPVGARSEPPPDSPHGPGTAASTR
jgi:hypothetical protein